MDVGCIAVVLGEKQHRTTTRERYELETFINV